MKIHANDLKNARVFFDGRDVSAWVLWVDPESGRALMIDEESGLAQFRAGAFVVAAEVPEQVEEIEEAPLEEAAAEVEELVEEEEQEEQKPSKRKRSR